MYKICNRCKVQKSLDMFSKDKTHADGYHSICKECNRKSYFEKYIKIKDRIKIFDTYKDILGEKIGKLFVLKEQETIKGKCLFLACKCDCGDISTYPIKKLKYGEILQCSKCNKKLYRKNIEGKIFSYLTVLSFDRLENGDSYWLCECICGNKIKVALRNLRIGGVKHCGCKSRLNIIGKRFSSLLVIEYLGLDKSKRSFWKCQCDCGNEYNVRGAYLTTGRIKSCGCKNDNNRHFSFIESNLTDKEKDKNRRYIEYFDWRYKVFKRDRNKCILCEDSGKNKLEAHHLFGYKNNVKFRVDINNGVTLCKNCHKEFHKKYHRGENTPEQFIEFVKTYNIKSLKLKKVNIMIQSMVPY